MASRLHALQQQAVDLQRQRVELVAALDALGEAPVAPAATATPEEKEAAAAAATARAAKAKDLNAKAKELTARIAANDEELAAVTGLHEAERIAPSTGAARQLATVTPLAESDPKRGYKNIGEMALEAAHAARRDGTGYLSERLRICQADSIRSLQVGAAAPSTLQSEGHSTEGFMVPPDFRNEIWKPAFENDDLLPLVNPQPTSSNSVQFLADETTPWGAQGIIAYWVAEAGQLSASKLATKGRELKLHKVAALVYATDEVLADAALLTGRIMEWAPMAIAWTASEAFMNGHGAGQPLGWGHASYSGRVSVAKETSQAADTILPVNLFKMHARLLTGPGARILWLANRDTLPEIGMMKIGNEPSWTAQNMGLKDAPNGLLLGTPIRWTEHCKTVGDTGDIQLVNFAGYAAYMHSSGTRFDSSIHLYFDYDINAFRWIMRLGGAPLLSGPISPANGAATRSYFIYLDDRA